MILKGNRAPHRQCNRSILLWRQRVSQTLFANDKKGRCPGIFQEVSWSVGFCKNRWSSPKKDAAGLEADYKSSKGETWAVYQRSETFLAWLAGLYWKIQAYTFICLLGLHKSHLCSVEKCLCDCLRIECLWFCWVLWSSSDLKHLLIIGAKEWQSAWGKHSGNVGVSLKFLCDLRLEMKYSQSWSWPKLVEATLHRYIHTTTGNACW